MILLRGGAETLEVLLVQRTPKARFMGGVWVFPGGAVDTTEGEGDEAHRVAAVRELEEEAGDRARRPGRAREVLALDHAAPRCGSASTRTSSSPPRRDGQEPRGRRRRVRRLGWFTPAGRARRARRATRSRSSSRRSSTSSSSRGFASADGRPRLRARARGPARRAARRHGGRGRADRAARRARARRLSEPPPPRPAGYGRGMPSSTLPTELQQAADALPHDASSSRSTPRAGRSCGP